MSETDGSRPAWADTSPADYDARLTVKGHKRAGDDQGALFYVPTPTREPASRAPAQLDGQADLFGGSDPA